MERIDLRRAGGLISVFGVGVGFAAVHLAHGLSEGEDLSTALFGIVIPTMLALVLLGCGYWLRRSDFGPEGVLRVGIWCPLGAAAMSAAGILIVLYQRAEGVQVSDGGFVVANAATVGAVVGFVVGVYDSRQRATSEQLLVERDRVERLNQRLTVLNRVLRHDIRTHVNVITGYVEFLENGDGTNERTLRIIERRTNEIARLSDDARRVERLLARRTERVSTVDIVAAIREQTERLDRTGHETDVHLDCSDREYVLTAGPIDAALRSVFDGLADHDGEGASLWVRVSSGTADEDTGHRDRDENPTRAGGAKRSEHRAQPSSVAVAPKRSDTVEYARVMIERAGCGVTGRELDALDREGIETPLDHADGLGLWLARWIVEESGGWVTVEHDPEDRAAVTIGLPRARMDEQSDDFDPSPDNDRDRNDGASVDTEVGTVAG